MFKLLSRKTILVSKSDLALMCLALVSPQYIIRDLGAR